MGLFNKNKQNFSPVELAVNNFRAAKGDLLFIIIATVVNVVLLFAGSGSYFLFSASIPYYLTVYGLLFTGRLPEEYTADFAEMPVLDDVWLYIMLALAFIVLALYAVCFFMLRKPNKVWFIVALVAFSVDTVALLLLTNIGTAFLDIVFHALIIFYLIRGIRACNVITNYIQREAEAPILEETKVEPNEGPKE